MAGVVYLGDEVSAAGWRLAGAAAHAVAAGHEAEALDAAMAQASLVLISAAAAACLDAARLASALAGLSPLVLVVPDPQGQAPLPDLAARLRAQLGIAA